MQAAACTIVPLLVLLTLAPAGVSAGATLASQAVVEKTKEAAVKTKDAVVKGTKIAAEQTQDGVSTTGEVMTDGWITTRVHARLVDEPLNRLTHADGARGSSPTRRKITELTVPCSTETGHTESSQQRTLVDDCVIAAGYLSYYW